MNGFLAPISANSPPSGYTIYTHPRTFAFQTHLTFLTDLTPHVIVTCTLVSARVICTTNTGQTVPLDSCHECCCPVRVSPGRTSGIVYTVHSVVRSRSVCWNTMACLAMNLCDFESCQSLFTVPSKQIEHYANYSQEIIPHTSLDIRSP